MWLFVVFHNNFGGSNRDLEKIVRLVGLPRSQQIYNFKMAAKIPSHIPKFRGDNHQSFKDWIAQLEAHCTALDVGAGKKIATLLCCLDSTAFSAVTEMIGADGAITYDNIKANLTTRFCGGL